MVLLWVEKKGKEKRNVRDKMGWVTAHFRPWVTTQERCRDRLSLALVRARRPGTRPSVRTRHTRHGFGARATWARHSVSQHNYCCRNTVRPLWCCDPMFVS